MEAVRDRGGEREIEAVSERDRGSQREREIEAVRERGMLS